MNYINHFTNNFNLVQFENFMLEQHNIIEEKEIHILFALSDLLPESFSENDFTRNSLIYLETNFNLTKGVWKVLLQLYDKVPYFVDILSHWKLDIPFYHSEDTWLHTRTPCDNLPYYFDNRKKSIQELFSFLNELVPHLSSAEICDLIPLISDKFDYPDSSFYSKKIKEYSTNVPRFKNYIFRYFMYQTNTLNYRLKNLSDKINYPQKRYIPKDKVVYYNELSNRLQRIDIKTSNPQETISTILDIVKKYTNHPFPSYLGFEELKKVSVLESEYHIVQSILKAYDESYHINKANNKLYVYFLKLIYSYKDNLSTGCDKIGDLYDYTGMSNDFYVKAKENPNFKLKDLLTWSNHWHLYGEHIQPFAGKREEFKKFNVNHSLSGYDFIQITNNHDLYLEGKSQQHCVFTYNKSCLNNDTIIVSMKDQNQKTVSTLRFKIVYKKWFFRKNKPSHLKFMENRKKLNKPCSEHEKLIAEQYFKIIENTF